MLKVKACFREAREERAGINSECRGWAACIRATSELLANRRLSCSWPVPSARLTLESSSQFPRGDPGVFIILRYCAVVMATAQYPASALRLARQEYSARVTRALRASGSAQLSSPLHGETTSSETPNRPSIESKVTQLAHSQNYFGYNSRGNAAMPLRSNFKSVRAKILYVKPK